MRLNLALVKQKAREYYEAGRLTPQHLDESMRECVYETRDGYRCAVGAALDDDTLSAIGAGRLMACSVDLIGCIELDPADRPHVLALQRLHDGWATDANKYGSDDNRTNQSRRDFLAMLLA